MSFLKKSWLPMGVAVAIASLAVRVHAESYFLKAWGLHGSYGVEAPKAWGLMKNDCSKSQAIVAVIDTGVDTNHPSLRNSMWVNPKYKGKLKSETSDVNGWDYAKNSGRIIDQHGHGTHIAGIISGDEAPGPLGNGFRGVCPGVRIMSLRYYDEKASGAENLKNTIRAIHYAIDNGATIINYSGGGAEFSSEEFKALKKARDRGVLVVAAAGNERSDADKALYYPAAYALDNIVSVAAIDVKGGMLSASNWGIEKVHVAAPGHSILSALPGGGYGYMSGTSQATAFVSGVAAMLTTENPAMNYKEVKRIIEDSALRQPSLVGKTRTSGRVNAVAAIERARETRKLSSSDKSAKRNPGSIRRKAK